MAKKLVIVGSDSFCDPLYPAYQRLGIEPWATRFAQKLDADLINVSKGGCSNRYIVNAVIDACMNNLHRELIVVCGWTESYRLSFADDTELDHSVFLIGDDEHEFRCQISPGLERFFTARNVLRQELLQLSGHLEDVNSRLVTQSFKNIWLLQQFCASMNIKFYHTHCQDVMANDYSLSSESYEQIQQSIMRNSYVQRVLKGVSYTGINYCLYNDIEQKQLFIENNLHPNQQGSDYIADMMYEFVVNYHKPQPNCNSKIYRIKQ